ncbi:GGDEF domain-containing protein [Lactobacillus sp. LC28-10]|uniref:GGDEF domain-containing protein n=1 Tax=Secundilactobacillus angelensis TaxID=2722706 RepID=A0ABX1L1U3_9LACO|nr:diguanylate cyclase [Secundilactobacillus angelensis]MCH5462518.1 diguanylate cyclase [Secundilactobacillus angelensis]NLR18291.1 GGDEF domain-containing protein [Secundilactobacillus angelensis]
MKSSVIWASFILSMLTNVIVLSGSISFLMWLEQLSNSWINRFRPAVETVLCTVYFAYLWGESWLNSAVAPSAFGFHWAFLNMLIVNSFLLNVYFKLRWQAMMQVVMMLAYVFSYDTLNLSTYTIIWAIAFVSVIFVSYHRGYKWIKHPVLMYMGIELMGLVSIGLIVSIFGMPTDPYFWIRQITALAILSVVGIEYTLSSNRLLTRTRATAKLAKMDGLTQLNNFSKFDEDLTQAYQHFQVNGDPYAVFEFDIDRFKQVNDHFGHLVGNTVLKSVAQELAHFAANTPYQTTAYRIGGEEFCLIVQADCSNHEFASDLANEVRRRVSQLSFKVGNGLIKVTVSVGQANSNKDQYNAHDIYKLADRSLYLSKERGRDRVTLEGQTIAGR